MGCGDSLFPSITADGRYVAFWSGASNLVVGDTNGQDDVFVRDRVSGVTERVSVASSGTEANGDSLHSSISADGRYVGFQSDASDLAAGDIDVDTDVFVHDRVLGTTQRVSVSSSGIEGNAMSWGATIGSDGLYVAFNSEASNLVTGDTNNAWDVFIAELGVFADIAGSVFEADIEWLAETAITRGCNPPANKMFAPATM